MVLPDGRGPEPKRPDIATGPLVRLWTDGAKDAEVNYASLLQDPYDIALMKYYVTGQLALIDVKTKVVKKVGAPGMIQSVDASPDGQYFRVTTMQEPFSYVVQYTRALAVWNSCGMRMGRCSLRSPSGRCDWGAIRRVAPVGVVDRVAKRGQAQYLKAGCRRGPGMYFLQQVPGGRGAAGDSSNAAPGAGGGGPRAGRGATGARWWRGGSRCAATG